MSKKKSGENRYIAVGKRLRLLFEGKNNSEIARILGVADNSVGRYLKGERLPPSECLPDIQACTGSEIDWLLTGNHSSVGEEKELQYAFFDTIDVLLAHHRLATKNPDFRSRWKDILREIRDSAQKLLPAAERAAASREKKSQSDPAG